MPLMGKKRALQHVAIAPGIFEPYTHSQQATLR